MVIIFAANKPSKKLLSNPHMCWESATCRRFRKHPFRWSGNGDLENAIASAFSVSCSLLAFAVCRETLRDGISFVAKPAVDITFV